MKKWVTLLIIASLVAGAFTTAFAQEISLEERLHTEGKIEAAMGSNQQFSAEQIKHADLSKKVIMAQIVVHDLQNRVAMDTEETGMSSNGLLSALGQIDNELTIYKKALLKKNSVSQLLLIEAAIQDTLEQINMIGNQI